MGTYGTKTAMWAYDGDRFHRVLKALAQGFGLGHSGAEVEVSALDGPWPPHLQGSRNAGLAADADGEMLPVPTATRLAGPRWALPLSKASSSPGNETASG